MSSECRRAVKVLDSFVHPVNGIDSVIPISVLKKAKGFAIITIYRAGFLMSIRAGTGVVVARLAQGGWSAPAEIIVGGLGGGFNAGAEMVDMLIVLNTTVALRSFMSSGSLQVGGNMSLSVGPLGRHGEVDAALSSEGKISAMYSYSQSRGLYGGVSIEGTVLKYLDRNNRATYGQDSTPKKILTGSYPVPQYAKKLVQKLESVTGWAPGTVAKDNLNEFLYDQDAHDIGVSADDPFGDNFGRPGHEDMLDDLDRELLSVPRTDSTERRSSATSSLSPTSQPRSLAATRKPAVDDPFADQGDLHEDEFVSEPPPVLDRSRFEAYAPGVREITRERTGSLVSEVPSATADDYDIGDELVTALYDYEAQQSGDLSFRRGDIIRVISSTGSQDGWWRGEIVRAGSRSEGLFPANFCERV
ncbi:hypothetical protein MCUN1_000112 [Malassezia cuniculi]|uniref:SH3 domain-containing protein n=1 Tax=Malassezia cuniculi TaxID=948313 RepID=A0AAF0J5E2_9BASI|nr:hypothetical protein MCUN1_000112 [Malassezia cuniculi]